MNIFRSKILTKILPFLTARYTILCTCRLQPTRDDFAAQVQWFSSVLSGAIMKKVKFGFYHLVNFAFLLCQSRFFFHFEISMAILHILSSFFFVDLSNICVLSLFHDSTAKEIHSCISTPGQYCVVSFPFMDSSE